MVMQDLQTVQVAHMEDRTSYIKKLLTSYGKQIIEHWNGRDSNEGERMSKSGTQLAWNRGVNC